MIEATSAVGFLKVASKDSPTETGVELNFLTVYNYQQAIYSANPLMILDGKVVSLKGEPILCLNPFLRRAGGVHVSNQESAVLAGGCFWGVEELLRKIPGVIDTEVGYTGGTTENPCYETVKTGTTGHAEAIDISYDPKIISFERLLDLFFQMHDPTTKNRQGNDVGTQYRSAIFVRTAEERQIAEKVIAKLNASGKWPKPIATEIENFKAFYSAEEYHQDYLQKNPGGYTCHYWRTSL